MKLPADKLGIQANLLDRAIEYVAPRLAAKRMAARGMMALAGGYTGARIDRASLKNWRPGGGSPTVDIIRDLPMLRDRTRDAVRNAPVGTGAVESSVTAIVGTGLACNPAIDFKFLGIDEDRAREWIADTKMRFETWASSTDCDVAEQQDFYEMQDLGLRSSFESGDSWVLTPMLERPGRGAQLALQIIEADRVCNPDRKPDNDTLQDGVELEADSGKPVAIHIARIHPGESTIVRNQWTRVELRAGEMRRRNALQIWKKVRPGQVRGIPFLAPILEPLKQLGRWTENELAAAVTSSLFTLFVKMDAEAFQEVFEEDAQNELVGQATGWKGGMENSKAVRLLPGEEIQSAQMNRPNPEFDPFWIAMVRQIGMALQIPYEVLVMHFQSSYSAARGALLMAWRFYRNRRDLLAKQMCQPVYELWLASEVAVGNIAAPGFFANDVVRAAWCKAVWTGDGPGSIDPEKEVRAARERVDLGISTLEAESVLHDGVAWEDKHRQRVREVAARKKDGVVSAAPRSAAAAPADSREQQQQEDEQQQPVQQ